MENKSENKKIFGEILAKCLEGQKLKSVDEALSSADFEVTEIQEQKDSLDTRETYSRPDGIKIQFDYRHSTRSCHNLKVITA